MYIQEGDLTHMAEKISKAKTENTYTEKELAAINALKDNKGTPKTAKELGVLTITLTSLITKANNGKPMAEGFERVEVIKTVDEGVCPVCGQKFKKTLYEIK